MTTQNHKAVATRAAAINEWDAGFQRLVTQTVLKPSKREATASELALLAEHAVRTGLDPMSRQIYGVYRFDRRVGGETMTIQVGIDGLRAVAERTGTYLGQSGPFWCDETGDWSEVWFKAEPPKAAKVIVRKAIGDHIAETPAVAHWDEYVPRKADGTVMGLWPDKPALMLAKCAEALALRKAFPQDLSGLYTDDEMARADMKAPQTSHAQMGSAEAAQQASDAPAGIAASTDRNGAHEGTTSEGAADAGRESAAPEPEPEDAVVVLDDERANGLDQLAHEIVETEVWTRRKLGTALRGAGATDTSSVGAAIRTLTTEAADELATTIGALLAARAEAAA